MRSNSLELSGDIMAVAYQTQKAGQKPAGFELFDVSVPEKPKSIAYVDASGPTSRGVHQLWFCDGEFVHMAAGAPDFKPTNPSDDQCYRIFDVRNPGKPVEGRFAGGCPAPARATTRRRRRGTRRPCSTAAFRAHNTNVYPQRPDRCYLAYLDAGMFVMDISDKANPKPICQWDNSPPYTGFTHTVVPMFERKLLIVTDEVHHRRRTDWPKLIWILDARDEAHPVVDLDLPDAAGGMPIRAAAAASAPTTSTRTRRLPMPGTPRTSSSARSSTAACAPTTSPIRTSPRKSPPSCRRRRQCPGRLDPAQRLLRRRAQGGLHRRPLQRRALHSGDGFLERADAVNRNGEHKQKPSSPGLSRRSRS